MDFGMLSVRLIHILCGVFWAGTLMFNAFLLEPSVREAGPGGAGVMPALKRRKFFTVMPVVAIITVLTGIDLMRRVSAGFQPSWFSSPVGAALSVGSAAAIAALIVGLGIMRPAAMQMGALAQAMADADGPDKDAKKAEIDALRGRARLAGRWVAGLLTVAVAGMAVARYMG